MTGVRLLQIGAKLLQIGASSITQIGDKHVYVPFNRLDMFLQVRPGYGIVWNDGPGCLPPVAINVDKNHLSNIN